MLSIDYGALVMLSIEFFRKYTKLVMLSFLYRLRFELQNNFSTNVPPVRMEPDTS